MRGDETNDNRRKGDQGLSLFKRYSFFEKAFRLDVGNRLLPLYEPPFEPLGMSGQYCWFVKNYGGYCIFFQVGKFCELYGAQAEKYSALFGWKLIRQTRRMGKQCGFPMKMLKGLKRKALLSGQPYIVVAEGGYYPCGLKRRAVTEVLYFKEGGGS